MGNITDRPKAPSPQVIYVPQTYESATGGNGTDGGTKTPTVAEQREKNLLGRDRSRLGTILTGFRGILAPVESGSQKKTLLGE